MPREGQIIPKYLHPHEETYINDNTFYEDYTAAESGPTFLFVFAGGRGRSELLKMSAAPEYVREYGYPDFFSFGQAPYMPYTALSQGNCRAFCLRLAAENATFANFILLLGYKVEGGKLVLDFQNLTRSNIREITDLEVYANSLETSAPDENGFRWMPIMMFWCLGKGSYGHDFRVRLTDDKNADKENVYKNYEVQVLSVPDGNKTIERYSITFDPDGIDPLTQVSNYFEDIFNDTGRKGSPRLNCKFFSDNYEKLFDIYKEVYENNGYVAPDIVSVDRMPAITLPSTSTLYHLTKNDGSRTAGSMYVYDDVNGVWSTSAFTVEDVATRPTVSTASLTKIYRITADYTTSSGLIPAGSMWITTDNANWIPGPTILDVEKLPSTQLYVEGTVYELTANDGSRLAGTQWIYNATAGDFVEYVEEDHSNPDELLYTIGSFDMFGYNRYTKEDDPFITFENGKESIAIMDLEGVPLASGDDGDFDTSVDAATREKAIERAYVNAFQGAVDKKILSVRRTPVDLVLDANLPISAKRALASMVIQRGDCSGRIDCGLVDNIYDVYDLGVTFGAINSYLVSKNAGMMRVADPFTGKNIPVSITLWMAMQYPIHYLNYGNHTPMAGENYAVLSGYVRNSIRPLIDADDYDIKEKLYAEYRINYLEALDEDTWVRGTQQTSQVENSDLSEENNVLVLMEIKRVIERYTARRRYRWAEPEDLAEFKESCDMIFSSYRGVKCKTLDIRVDMNDWEKTRYIVHVYLSVVFRTFQKRAIIEIDVDPRV